jgi:mono/diheme cytochrome c family protein
MKILKVLGGLLAVLVTAVVLLVGFAYFKSNRSMNADWDVTPVAVQTSSDSATLAHGKHVAETRGCMDCHDSDLSGRLVVDAMPVMMRVAGPNLTSGQGGVGASYSDADWVRSIRDGIGPDGKALLFMPSYEYRALGPEDLGALISFIKSAPPVDEASVELAFGPMARVLYTLGQFPLVAPELVDHSDTRFSQPEAGVTVEYGGYLASSCVGCHGPGFSGGKIPGGDPSWPAAANLTPHESGLASWTFEGFNAFAQTGMTPDGRQLDAAVMPWLLLAAATEAEREAMWMYLESLPPTEHGSR